jgi:Insertion element 4 transposase N-terminal/Transposase DDE domain
MPRNPNVLAAGVRLADKLTMAQLHRYFPTNIVKDSLERAQKATKRTRELPNEFMAYYPMMLCLYREVSQQEVLRVMADGLSWLFGLSDVKVTGKSGISQARARVGSEPLIDVFDRCARPLAKPGSKGCFYRGLRLVAIDGSDLDLDDCSENSQHFGRSRNQHGEGAYPKARLVGLVEVGTRAAFALSVGKHEDSENSLALNVIPKLSSGMLCLGDRLFMSWEIFDQAQKRGAELLFRGREDRNLPVENRLPDGSYLSTIYAATDRKQEAGIKVRVIEYDAEVTRNGNTTKHGYRLITTLTDYKVYPFAEVANLYRERWEFETMLDEVKTHLMNSQPLRSRTPDLVIQEIYGMLMAHYTIRAVMYEAAASENIDPDELSFTHSRNVVERNLPKFGAFPPSTVIPAHL